jgi:hypothetical protein
MCYEVYKGEHPIEHFVVQSILPKREPYRNVYPVQWICLCNDSQYLTVLTAVTFHIVVIQDVTPCSLGDEYRGFVEAAGLIS